MKVVEQRTQMWFSWEQIFFTVAVIVLVIASHTSNGPSG